MSYEVAAIQMVLKKINNPIESLDYSGRRKCHSYQKGKWPEIVKEVQRAQRSTVSLMTYRTDG